MSEILNITLKKAAPPGTGEAAALPPLAASQWLFKGDEGNPFLAPRGVFIKNGSLFVSDTGQNRVFIWHHLPEGQTHQKPDVVLGQIELSDTGRNAGAGVTASSLQYPSGIWSDGRRLIVADAWNHRVLIWNEMPTQHGQPADVVVGQPDFGSNLPNVQGIGAAPSERSLNWPYGVFSDGERLWIADTGNRRILFFEKIPTENYAAADGVVGKPSFTERDYDHHDPIWCYSVKIGPQGQMAVADTQYYRVLLWHDWRTAFHQKADLIIGQPGMDSSGMNRYGLYPQANSLSWCYDACFYKNGLFVADTGNSRVLWFEQVPSANGLAADNLIGPTDFHTGSENANTVFGTDKALYWPFSICPDGGNFAVADTGNHRVVVCKLVELG